MLGSAPPGARPRGAPEIDMPAFSVTSWAGAGVAGVAFSGVGRAGADSLDPPHFNLTPSGRSPFPPAKPVESSYRRSCGRSQPSSRSEASGSLQPPCWPPWRE